MNDDLYAIQVNEALAAKVDGEIGVGWVWRIWDRRRERVTQSSHQRGFKAREVAVSEAAKAKQRLEEREGIAPTDHGWETVEDG